MKTYRILEGNFILPDFSEVGPGQTITLEDDAAAIHQGKLQLIADSEDPEVARLVQARDRELALGADAAVEKNGISSAELHAGLEDKGLTDKPANAEPEPAAKTAEETQ